MSLDRHVGSAYVPPDRFDHYAWMSPSRPPWAPKWYYWRKIHSPNPGNCVDLATVDPLLRKMVELANRKGVRTLPSCQGHFHDPRDTKEQAQWLKMEEPMMRRGTLPLTDTETRSRYLYRDPSYVAPTVSQLAEAMRSWSGVGRVGFVFNDPQDANVVICRCIPIGSVMAQGNKVSIVISDTTEKGLSQRWKAVEKILIDTL